MNFEDLFFFADFLWPLFFSSNIMLKLSIDIWYVYVLWWYIKCLIFSQGFSTFHVLFVKLFVNQAIGQDVNTCQEEIKLPVSLHARTLIHLYEAWLAFILFGQLSHFPLVRRAFSLCRKERNLEKKRKSYCAGNPITSLSLIFSKGW